MSNQQDDIFEKTKKEAEEESKGMIQFRVKFWTNNLPSGLSRTDKFCWSSGTVYRLANKELGIKPKTVFFNEENNIVKAISVLLRDAKITTIQYPQNREKELKRK